MSWLCNSSSRQTLLKYKHIRSGCHFLDGAIVKTSPSSAEGASPVPGGGTKTPYASQPQNVQQKQNQ